ncbi:TTAGGG repeat binding factor [Ophidiomyces ophidiicola]|uniref:TTAGGG repeat binding factor n=1 Tax=Ophidiomyces ophidiicola TaxID=1387563 RepID=A0ACB8UV78_9EURO|nr:TTAGGG repeat binding factor [Ophidiomyces ophidiicola]KAI1944972.1 TTAGGG repeat binding factor [Ophidiomyces ophidiicola]KAI1945085.1 TTAGGG repeat binding factor [Ophidiomyces ophidiicola]KAI1971164.1 TTAGGG repeat binding factor [Ophidiomyces ophidiicola]KAI2016970.1 TTAGGG repeat binding factor [Ophidiomyces ophidiicola]KAI2050189.1 TTAGGG repeat binding factor [Ophidiomyces ophidiicola]
MVSDAKGLKASANTPPSTDPNEPTSSVKTTHPRDDDNDESSPASKRQRTGIADNVVPSIEEQLVQATAAQSTFIGKQSDSTADGSFHNVSGPEANTHTSIGDDASPEATSAPSNSNIPETIPIVMDHPGPVENQSLLKERLQDTTLSAVKSNPDWKIQSLPILDNLATQILSLLARSSYQDITSIVSEPNSETGHAYATMRSLFDHTKKVYSMDGPFLSASKLGFATLSQVDIIRKANMATFASSIFGSQIVGFSELHDHFLEIFVPEGSRLLKGQGALFLELKTQAFIASTDRKDQPLSEMVHNLFPEDLGTQLLARRPGNKQLAPSETDFVKRAWSRRDILLKEIDDPELVTKLRGKYRWEDFLRDLCSYISKNFDSITSQKTNKGAASDGTECSNQTPVPASEPRNMPLQTQFPVAPSRQEPPVDRSAGKVDLVARAARAAQIALQGQRFRLCPRPPSNPHPQATQGPPQQQFPPAPVQNPPTTTQPNFSYAAPVPVPPPPPQPNQVTFQNQFQFQQYNPQAASAATRANASGANYGYMPGIPHYSQSQPTQILYERARMATTAKSSPTSRRAGLPSQRRPWTPEEENALMAGLDRVKGPHWSQILAMFGPGGTINEALKDRNQVQLKDKARNLKLFFLKSGIEVPYYLKFVTGELKTRAPAQAAKQEARERERRRGEEDKAHVEGLEGMMALAGAHAPHGPSDMPSMAMATPPPYPPIQEQHQETLDQSTEQVLIQRLTQEAKSENPGPPQQQNAVDPSLENPV